MTSSIRSRARHQYSWQPALDVTAGRFVADNWLLGVSISGKVNSGRFENQDYTGQLRNTNTQRNTSVDITPFVRRYWQFAPVQVFAGAGLSISNTNGSRTTNRQFPGTTQPTNPSEEQTNGFSIGPHLEAGVNYFLTNRLALQLSASTGSLPLGVSGFNAGLVYWTGPGRQADPQQTRDNVQTNRGNWIVEGSFSANRGSTDQTTSTIVQRTTSGGYSLSPSFGYFISRNNVLGISISAGIGTYESSGQNSPDRPGNYWSVGISPYVQHYWTDTRLTPYTRVSATYAVLGAGANESNRNSVSAALGIGLAYMAGQRFIIETSLVDASLGYIPSTNSRDDATSWGANLSAGLRGNFAVRYVLTRPN